MARFILAMEAIREQKVVRRKRRLAMRAQFDVYVIPDPEFIMNYRLNKTLFELLCQDVIPLLHPQCNITGINPVVKVLTALNFYARGSYQGSVGNNADAPMAQQTVSRCLRQFTDAMNQPHIVAKYIKFPQNRQERTTVKSRIRPLNFVNYLAPVRLGLVRSCSNTTEQPTVTEEEKERELERIVKHASLDDPPTACCRSGCSNCVFIVWAEALANKMENAGPEIKDKVLNMVDDPSLKAFLEMELRLRLKK